MGALNLPHYLRICPQGPPPSSIFHNPHDRENPFHKSWRSLPRSGHRLFASRGLVGMEDSIAPTTTAWRISRIVANHVEHALGGVAAVAHLSWRPAWMRAQRTGAAHLACTVPTMARAGLPYPSQPQSPALPAEIKPVELLLIPSTASHLGVQSFARGTFDPVSCTLPIQREEKPHKFGPRSVLRVPQSPRFLSSGSMAP